MLRAKLFCVAMALLCLGSSRKLYAFDDWQPINSNELKMKSDAAHPGDAIILYREETADDMTRHLYVYKRLKVLTERGKDRASVEIPYDGSFIGISDIRARTISPDGTITPFTGKAFNSTIVKAHGVKYLAKTFTLPNVQVGSIIEWKYTKFWEEYVVAPHWVLQDDLPTVRAKFTFVPLIKANQHVEDSRGDIKDRVYYSTVRFPKGAEIKTIHDDKMQLEIKDIPAFVEEDFSLPSEILKMRVDFYYGTDKMSKPQEFWKTEGKFWSKEVEKFAGHSAAVTTAVNQVISPADTPDQKARKIYAYVQKIKNLTYTQQQGDLDEVIAKASKEKRSVETVIQNKEGYHNEIARVFWAMGRAAGLQIYLMRVSDRDEFIFQENIPNSAQLTSEIAIVNVDGKEVFLDPGTPLCPYGHLAWQHSSSQGVRQTPDGSAALAASPLSSYKDSVSKRVGHLILNDDGSAKGQIGVGWTGEEALIHRLNSLKTDEAGRKKELEDELKAMLPTGSLVQMETSSGWDTPETQLNASFAVEVPSYATSTGKRMVVPADLFQAQRRQPFAHGERHNSVYFSFPYYSTDETQITFPATFHMENMPDVQPISTGYSFYKLAHSAAGNTVTVSRDFAMGGILFQQDQYADLRKFFDGVVAGDSEPLVLTAVK